MPAAGNGKRNGRSVATEGKGRPRTIASKMAEDAVKDANAFDVSGTSVSSLQFFLDGTAVTTIDVAIETLREYCPDCTPHVANATLVANKWEVAQIRIPGFTNEDFKSAIRIFTAELPYPFYKWTNAPFFSKVRQRLRRLLWSLF
jgi:hypothetical protein